MQRYLYTAPIDMGNYLLKQLAFAPVVLLTLVTISFFMIRWAPGGPFDQERDMPDDIRQAIEAKYNLDSSMPAQYWSYLCDLSTGDFGPSFSHRGQSVNDIIWRALPKSIYLGCISMALALILGISAGIMSAIRQRSLLDYSTMVGAMAGLSIPNFVIGPMLVLVFCMWLDWLPAVGYESPAHLILPSLTLALPFIARIARLTRAGMLDIVRQDFIRTARAKGLPEWHIVCVHMLRGGIIPVIGFLGPATAAMLTGSIVVEKIFQIDGLGQYFVKSAIERDYGMVMGTTIIYGLILIVLNSLSDVLYALADPRVRHANN